MRTKPRQAPQRVAGTGRERQGWVRPFRRVHRALDASFRLIASSLHTVARSERCAHRRPVRSSRNLQDAGALLVTASACIVRAARELAKTNACLGRDPECPPDLPQLLIEATERWVFMTGLLEDTADDVFALYADVLHGLASGTLVPEPEPQAGRRPRIILVPRPVPLRAFLRARQPRAADRISPVLHRRRRTPRPAAVSVPRRTSQGRAPPPASLCPL